MCDVNVNVDTLLTHSCNVNTTYIMSIISKIICHCYHDVLFDYNTLLCAYHVPHMLMLS